ncbi:MAG: hypothetical protein JWP88_2241 [Flaviaesturariibacter sp.]|nr:hypothetical protein [Flaviaesturariibacter sp.]
MCAMHSEEPNRILVVDDDVDLVMLLERKLVNLGFEVETAISLPEAEDILREFHPQLLLLDINLNGIDGRQLSFKLRNSATHHNVRIIMLSGYDCSASRAALFGADELVVKPFSFEFLLNRIEHYLIQLVIQMKTNFEDPAQE